jgi:hypothetical protein
MRKKEKNIKERKKERKLVKDRWIIEQEIKEKK